MWLPTESSDYPCPAPLFRPFSSSFFIQSLLSFRRFFPLQLVKFISAPNSTSFVLICIKRFYLSERFNLYLANSEKLLHYTQ